MDRDWSCFMRCASYRSMVHSHAYCINQCMHDHFNELGACMSIHSEAILCRTRESEAFHHLPSMAIASCKDTRSRGVNGMTHGQVQLYT